VYVIIAVAPSTGKNALVLLSVTPTRITQIAAASEAITNPDPTSNNIAVNSLF